jgi:hypothetical protein
VRRGDTVHKAALEALDANGVAVCNGAKAKKRKKMPPPDAPDQGKFFRRGVCRGKMRVSPESSTDAVDNPVDDFPATSASSEAQRLFSSLLKF